MLFYQSNYVIIILMKLDSSMKRELLKFRWIFPNRRAEKTVNYHEDYSKMEVKHEEVKGRL